MLIEVCQAIKRENATLSKARKTQKIDVDQIETITLFRERLASIIKIDKLTSILIEENVFFDLALFFAS